MRLAWALPLLLVGCLGAFDGPDDTPQVPVWSVGDAWTYAAGSSQATWTVTGVELHNQTMSYKVQITGLGPTDTRWFAVDHLALAGREFLGIETAYGCAQGPFPLTDKTYVCSIHQGESRNSEPHRIEVIGPTEVTVPAGTFETIEFVDRLDAGGYREFGRYWYADEVRHWVAFEVNGTRWELT